MTTDTCMCLSNAVWNAVWVIRVAAELATATVSSPSWGHQTYTSSLRALSSRTGFTLLATALLLPQSFHHRLVKHHCEQHLRSRPRKASRSDTPAALFPSNCLYGIGSPMMAPFVTTPEPSDLLPPLLACLPTAFISQRPPPALLPLLSPILRQRVQLLGGQSESSWLPLLCWDPVEAPELATRVETSTFEPHPVSGEIELGDVGIPVYQRKDEETLQVLMKIPDFGLQTVHVWCELDEAGGGPGWRLSELRLLDLNTSTGWYDSIGKANSAHDAAQGPRPERISLPALVKSSPGSDLRHPSSGAAGQDDGDEDGDYWARYDAPPGRTPGPSQQPQAPTHGRTMSEVDYYSSYSRAPQTIDDQDAEESQDNQGVSGAAIQKLQEKLFGQTNSEEVHTEYFPPQSHLRGEPEELVHTRPSSSSSSPNVAHFESIAAGQSRAELAVQQHIGTTIKSLFKLASGAGMERADFQRLVQNELDLLQMWDEE